MSVISLLIAPFCVCLILTGIHVYLGIHVLSRGVVFVDLALAQIAALGATIAFLMDLPHDTGEWFSNYTGRIGPMRFRKAETPTIPPQGERLEALRGTYQGALHNTNPQSNLPERMQVSFVTSQDLTVANGIKITGSLRLYLGPFGSTEYVEMPFTDVQFNFFTRELTAKTSGDYKLTYRAHAESRSIAGKLYADALGEVGEAEVFKQ